VWWQAEWVDTPIFEQSDLWAGNVIAGPAIVESPADTLAVPPGRSARLDQHLIFHLETQEV
jgi:N-methylhydantoinase A/oxoprolinase/acetone carboxylase beta subunit